ncbi:MAG TPA: PAS domain S-box protein, partial [Spirochaetia bacterium]|nr:PAS domain S-box protein [Spirochaetia bacterium]
MLSAPDDDLFKVLSDNSPIGIFILQDSVFCFVNPQLENLSGCPGKELLGGDFGRFIVPEDRDVVRQSAIAMLKGIRRVPYEYRFQRQDGEYRWAMEAVSSITYRGKRAVLGYFMDITERKQDEVLFQALSDNSPIGMFIVQDGVFCFANPQLEN